MADHKNLHPSIERAPFDEKNSYRCDSEIFNIDVPSIEKLTFIALARYFTDDNTTMPTHQELARGVGCSEKRIAIALERLSEHVVFIPHPVIFKQQEPQ